MSYYFKLCFLLSFSLIYLYSVSQTILFGTLWYSSLYPQNRARRDYNDHSPEYSSHHIYKVHILKRIFFCVEILSS